jgi:aryl-alcohol dehydrogenase-like predicted oxidoreductase
VHGVDRFLLLLLPADTAHALAAIAFTRNLGTTRQSATEASATPVQIGLAWLPTRGDNIAPIPGTKRVARVEENTAADAVELTAEQIEKLNSLPPASGDTHDEAGLRMIER